MGWRHDSNGCPYIFDHAEHVPNTPDIARRWLVTGIKMAASKTEVEITFQRYCDGAAISTSTPIVSIMPDSDMTLSTLPDVGDY